MLSKNNNIKDLCNVKYCIVQVPAAQKVSESGNAIMKTNLLMTHA